MSIPIEWLHGQEPLPAVKVRKMEPGTKIMLIGADRYGEKVTRTGSIAQSGTKRIFKFGMAYEDTMPIRDYPNKVWVKGE